MRKALFIGAMVIAVAGCTGGDEADSPSNRKLGTTITLPSPANASGVALPVTPGLTTTTKLAIRGGSASIGGRATDTAGAPAAGAVVHLERLVGDDIAVADVPVGADGRWKASGVKGGRYRLRAWRVPDLAMTTNEIFFLAGNENKNINLSLNRYDQRSTSFAAAPNPLILNRPANIALRVNRRSVDRSGIIGAVGEGGLGLTLAVNSGVTLESGAAATTDGSGQAVWRVRCVSTGSASVTVAFATGESQMYQLPPCVIPAPVTTAPAPDAGDDSGAVPTSQAAPVTTSPTP